MAGVKGERLYPRIQPLLPVCEVALCCLPSPRPPCRVHHLVQFFLQHHPCIKLNSRHEWVDGKFVMVDVDKDNVRGE